MIGFFSGFLAVLLVGLTILQLVQKRFFTLSGWTKKQNNLKLYWFLTIIYLSGAVSMTFYVVYY